ncbi:MAG: pyridoxal phosphate-dependent aminotransferase family protein [Crocinitomicaceae bacterium]|nr:pyridoxal phosphate-dependent aminotransferase family protein [Crocinitomicaceae bacterium]
MKLDKYLKRLEERRANGLFRELSSFSFEEYVDFCSNNYLGLATKTYESELDFQAATGSRLISGNSELYDHTEVFLADFFESDSALIFNSGYDANLGFFGSVPQKGDTVIYDEYIHASVRDGIRLSHAKNLKFQHNSIEDLENKLLKAEGEIFVAVESVYSMDGDFAPLEIIADLCQKYNAKLIVDEAHSAGIYGPGGRGLVVKLSLQDKVFARLVTFGKAYGSHGAVVLGNKNLRDYLINFARSFIYSTGLPNVAVERIFEVVQNGKYMEEMTHKLFINVDFFKSLFSDSPMYQINSESPIQTLIIPGNEAVKRLEAKLLKEKIWCKAILSPTVPEGMERLRVSIHSFNSKKEIEKLYEVVA